MRFARIVICLLASACTTPSSSRAPDGAGTKPEPAHASPARNANPRAPSPIVAPATIDLSPERALLDDANTALRSSDLATARSASSQAVAALLARPEAEHDAAWLELLDQAGTCARAAQDPATAISAWNRVLEVRSHSLGDDHAELESLRVRIGASMYEAGDFRGARGMFEKVLASEERTLPDDHPSLQSVRANLAATIAALGDLHAANTLLEKVLAVDERTLGADDPRLQLARQNLAIAKKALGDLAGARALEEAVLEAWTRTLPDDHPDLQRARGNLGNTLLALGDLSRARALHEKVVEVRTRTLPADHFDLQSARLNLAATLDSSGDLETARSLFERVVEVFSRTLPADHPDLQTARMDFAATIDELGDHAGAQELLESVLEVRSRTLPDEHPHVQLARQNLAGTMTRRGDLAGARALLEKVLEVDARTLPDDHPDLQAARLGLATTMFELGDLAGARVLQERALEVDSRTLPADHPDLQLARQSLGSTLLALGDLRGARELFDQVLEVRSRTLPDDHSELQDARENVANTIAARAARLELDSTAAAGAPKTELVEMQRACTDLIGALARSDSHAARLAIMSASSREAEERCANLSDQLDCALSFAVGVGAFGPLRELESPAFALAETTRGAAIRSREFARSGASAPKYLELRDALKRASDELAELAHSGSTRDDFDRARTNRDRIERELVATAGALPGAGLADGEFDADSLASTLEPREAFVGFRRFAKSTIEVANEPEKSGEPRIRRRSVESLCAFVLRGTDSSAANGARKASLALVSLGPIAPIEAAVRGWRDAIGVGSLRGVSVSSSSNDFARERAEALRRLVFDPLIGALGDSDHLVVALDDVLNLVPLDALASTRTNELVGERWRIETRATATELTARRSPPTGDTLVALGGASFNSAPEDASAESTREPDASSVERSSRAMPILRGTIWERGFALLPYTADEARGVASLHDEVFGDAHPGLVLEKRKASRAALEGLAPSARFLHVATHGWFAPESIESWSDPEPLDPPAGFRARTSRAEQVKGMSPMLLSGLALAGANLPENAVGRVPGLITAEEISALDLASCELVVLSACDTNVGERRAGQGVASLQKALQMAGARSVITSLWKVPDEATKELMLDFYRRLWVEKKPKWRALWEAKMKLRDATDERGERTYSTRDWAAWVLTGDPN